MIRSADLAAKYTANWQAHADHSDPYEGKTEGYSETHRAELPANPAAVVTEGYLASKEFAGISQGGLQVSREDFGKEPHPLRHAGRGHCSGEEALPRMQSVGRAKSLNFRSRKQHMTQDGYTAQIAAQVITLQNARLEGRISEDDYQRLKADLLAVITLLKGCDSSMQAAADVPGKAPTEAHAATAMPNNEGTFDVELTEFLSSQGNQRFILNIVRRRKAICRMLLAQFYEVIHRQLEAVKTPPVLPTAMQSWLWDYRDDMNDMLDNAGIAFATPGVQREETFLNYSVLALPR